MAAKTGTDTAIGFRLNSTGAFDGHRQASTGDLLVVNNFNHSKGVTELRANPIGAGIQMDEDSYPGSVDPSITLSKIARYDDAGMFALAQLFGTNNTMNMGSSAYIQSILFNETRFGAFGTLGLQNDTTNALDYENVIATKISFNGKTNDFLMQSIDLLATNRRISGAQNSVTSLNSVTLPSGSAPAVIRSDDYFYINTQSGGALSSGDIVHISEFSFEFMFDAENVAEIRGASGLGQPRASGDAPFQSNVVITLKNQQNNTWLTALDAETEYKATLRITGGLIGGSNYEFIEFNFPRLKMVVDQEYNLTSPAENPTTIRFKVLHATSAPTGMIDAYPYVRLQNRRSTSYLA